MFGEMLDTSPEQRERYYRQLAALSPQERVAALCRRLERALDGR